jgi:hypothetical protein
MLYQLSYSRMHAADQSNLVRRRLPEPLVGFEPTTARLRIECSTPELQWQPSDTSGAEGNRTPDLCSAIAALSHLSYGPADTRVEWAVQDSNL